MNLNDLFLVTDKDIINYINYSTDETKLTTQIETAEFKDYIPVEHHGNPPSSVCNGLIKFLRENSTDSDIVWNKCVPNGKSKAEHYNTFLYSLIQMSQQIYMNTKRVTGNIFIIASDVATVFSFMDGFEGTDMMYCEQLGDIFRDGKITTDALIADIFQCPELPSGEVICIAKTPDNMSASIAVSIKDDKWSAVSLNKGMAVRGQVICREEG